MKKALWIAGAVMMAGGAPLSTGAHPGVEILTLSGQEKRAAMTDGITYEDIKGVHVFRGRARLAGGEPASASARSAKIAISLKTPRCVYRSFRTLRTQGFYSGKGAKSRRYTQGFYSGR